ncbi:MAG TPA: VTT domain-containing protein, partial [Polyangiaceae bacterium]
MKLSRAAGWTVLAVLLLALILVPFLLGESAVFDASRRLLSEPGSRPWLGALVVGLLAADLFLPIPSSFVAAGAVAAFGGIFGGTVVWLGLTAAALLGYAVGRYGGAALALRVVGAAELARAERLHQRFGALVLIVCRGVPVLAEASTVFAGALRMRLAHFMLVTSS